MRTDVAFACEHFQVSERWACKLLGVDRSSYRYEPRPDRNAEPREAFMALARANPRYGYRRFPARRCTRAPPVGPSRIYRQERTAGSGGAALWAG